MFDQERRRKLATSICKLPRVKLAHLPTPLEEAPRLSEALGGTRILFKRDDLTGLPLSGNKTRMFEFSLAQALEQGADTVVQSSSVQSNYCRQLALACSKLGLEAYLILRRVRGEKDLEIQGNLLLDLLAGAKVEIVDADVSEQRRLVREKAEMLRRQGRKVYEARGTDRDIAIEAVAYVACTLELCQQLEEMQIEPNCLFVPAHDTTQAGLLVGAKYLGVGFQVVGINPFEHASTSLIAQIANNVAEMLELGITISEEEVVNTINYVGDGYGKVTSEALDAIRLVAQTEAICLDPVYTGKTMAALVDFIRQRRVKASETAVFVHTGGFPSLFAYHDELEAALCAKPVFR